MKSSSKKNTFLATRKNVTPSISKPSISAKAIAQKAGDKIKKGLERPVASTGTPIKDLHGGPKFMALMSNIGGGSIKTGGGGIKECFKTVLGYTEAMSTLKAELNGATPGVLDATKTSPRHLP